MGQSASGLRAPAGTDAPTSTLAPVGVSPGSCAMPVAGPIATTNTVANAVYTNGDPVQL